MVTPVITRENVLEWETNRFCKAASDLGLKPGEWPTEFATTLGNGGTLRPVHVRKDREGDIEYVLYTQDEGLIELQVYND